MDGQLSVRPRGIGALADGRGLALAGLGLLLLSALALLALGSTPASASPMDNETPPNPPRYYDYGNAYNLSVGEAPANITFRRDGGGDFDFLRLQGLEVGDLVNVSINTNDTMPCIIEFWVSDPYRFPVYYCQYSFQVGDPNTLSFEFMVVLDGDYFLHTGQGPGETFITFNWSVTPGGGVPDGNDEPGQAVRLVAGNDTSTDMDCVYDPSDFFVIDLTPNASLKMFLEVTILEVSGGNYQWELYNTTGLLRESVDYKADTIFFDTASKPFFLLNNEGDLYMRLWCTYGKGTVRFRLDLVDQPKDGDDILTAVEVRDGDIVVGDLDTITDEVDFFKIALVQGDVLNLWLEVEDDLDLFLRDSEWNFLVRSDGYGNVTEHIVFEMMAAGPSWFYIMVRPYGIDPLDPPVEMSYILRVRTNLDPVADPAAAGLDGVHIVYEDVPDESIDLGLLFSDPEDGPLTYFVLPGHDEARLNASLNGTRLRLEAAPDDSGFWDTVDLKAVDDHGYWCVYAVQVYVKDVNDQPVLVLLPANVTMDEDGTSAPVNLVSCFNDVDDPSWNLTVTVECPAQLRVALMYGAATFSAMVPDWNGETHCIVVATDPGGLNASVGLVVVVRPVNDAPVIRQYANMIWTYRGPFELDVTPYFFDVDGDALSYLLGAPEWMSATFEGGVLTIKPPEDVFMLCFNITASDPSGLESEPMPVMVSYNDPELPPPGMVGPSEYTVEEGTTLYLTNITFLYFDRPRSLLLTLTAEGTTNWYAVHLLRNGTSWQDGLPAWTPEKLRRARDVHVILRCEDDEGFSDDLTITVHVLRYNRAPVVLRVGPDTSKAYHQGDEVLVFADAVDPDGDPLAFTWYFDDEMLNITGNTLMINHAVEGVHRVRVTASDGELNMTNNGSFVVLGSETAEGAWSTAVIIAAVVIVVGATAGVLHARRRRGGAG